MMQTLFFFFLFFSFQRVMSEKATYGVYSLRCDERYVNESYC